MIFIWVFCVCDDVMGILMGLDVRNGEEFIYGLDVVGGNMCFRVKNYFIFGGDFMIYCWRKDKYVYVLNDFIFYYDFWWIFNREY